METHDRPEGEEPREAAPSPPYFEPVTAWSQPPPYPPQPPDTAPRRKVATAVAALALVVAGGLVGGGVVALAGGGRTKLASPTVVSPASDKLTGIAAIAKAVQPSVVSITVATPIGQEEGSGVVLRSDGTILTNNHVAAGAAQGGQLAVKFSDGKKTTASVTGTDPATDLAVIKAQGVSDAKPATLGSSDRLRVGDPVVAIGSPLGLEGSVTAGIVSALHRTLSEGGGDQQLPQIPGRPGQQGGTAIGDAIQTDAAINPGNSGGPLVNGSGQVVGVNTAIATSGGGNGNIGVGFAIPIDSAKQVADQLIKSGKATHAFLGVTLSDALGGQQGALIASVQRGAPAQQAGLQEGDIVTEVEGKAIEGAENLSAAIRGHQPGDRITLTYVRGGQKHTVTVSLASSSGN
jgi:putative serine protease PepD